MTFRFTQLVRSSMLLGLLAFATSPNLAAEDTPQATTELQQLRQNLREMIWQARDEVFPALVNIQVITSVFVQGKERKGQSIGSGTIISESGYVLTNYHVVRNGLKFTCTLADRQEIEATLVGEDPLTDLAVLKLDMAALSTADGPLPTARLGDSGRVDTGDTVIAMGSPWALSRSVTRGIVSNTERIFGGNDPGEMRFDRDQRTGIFTNWIQHDAAIGPGNSGGPLVNLEGEVVGVNALGGGNMGFAIPSNLAKVVSAALIEHGHVPRSDFGWSLMPIKNTGYTQGVLVDSVTEHGPADQAGVQAGDVLTHIDGDAVKVWFPEEEPLLLMKLAALEIGSRHELEIQRDGEAHQVSLVTQAMQPDRSEEVALQRWGLVVMDITSAMARNRRLPGSEGVLVSDTQVGSAAQSAEPPLLPDDVIVAVNQVPVVSLADLKDIYDQLGQGESSRQSVLVEFNRRGRSQLTILKVAANDADRRIPEIAKAWVGVAVQPVLSELAAYTGSSENTGFRITRVYPGTSAADSELRTGDLVIAINEQPLRPRTLRDGSLFHRKVREMQIGDTVNLGVLRDGSYREFPVELESSKLTPDEVERDLNQQFGLTVREITFFDRDENRWPADIRGLLVDDVERAGFAQLGGVRTQDLILEVDGQPVRNMDGYRALLDKANQDRPERMTIVVLRGADTRYLFLEPDWTL